MKKIIKIKSNIKSIGDAWSYDIGDNTLLVGPNESGKSAVGEAIQLALTGSVSNILLKSEVKNSTELECLFPSSSSAGFAEVTFSDKTICTWKKTRGKAPSMTGDASVVFPISSIKKILQGSEEKVTKFLFEYFGAKISITTFKDLIPAGSVLPEEEFKSLLPDLGRKLSSEEELDALDYLDMAEDAAKIAREESSKSRFLAKCYKQFSVVSPQVDNLMDLWEELTLALRYETMKKMYVNADHEIRDGFMIGELRKLGAPKDLREMRGSAIIHDEITDVLNSRALYDYTKKTREESIVAATLSKNMSNVSKAMVEVIRILTVKYLDQLTSRVNDYLPEGDEFFMEITPSKCYYGLRKEDGRHRALSGSTEARVLAALACALSKPGEEAVVLVDDRMWDTGTLSRTMSALEGSPCQIIMMTTMKPRGRKRTGWDYIEMGETGGESNGNSELNRENQRVDILPDEPRTNA